MVRPKGKGSKSEIKKYIVPMHTVHSTVGLAIPNQHLHRPLDFSGKTCPDHDAKDAGDEATRRMQLE